MTIAYDHHTNTIAIGHTKEEYLRLVGEAGVGDFGLHFYARHDDDIERRISFRHEHAHFTSFQATGLAELHSIVQDWKLTILFLGMYALPTEQVVAVPLIIGGKSSYFTQRQTDALSAAWEQALAIESFLFGLGTKLTVGELFRVGIVDRLLDAFPSALGQVNAMRFRKFLKQVCFTTPMQTVNDPSKTMFRATVAGDSAERRVSSLAVLEAYAITIEVVAEHIKSMWTSRNILRATSKRTPPPCYTIGIEAILDDICPERGTTLAAYLDGHAGADVYWAVALTAYAAMQVPVVEDPWGETLAMGSLKQLYPAYRLCFILLAIKKGSIPNPLDTYEDRMTDGGKSVVEWLNASHLAIGDPWSLKFYQHIEKIVVQTPEFSRTADKLSHHQLSWLARTCFWSSPCEMIGDGGIWLTACQIRFIRTSDGYILGAGEPTEVLPKYFVATSVCILQAMMFGESWFSCWDKVGPFSREERQRAMKAVLEFNFSQAGRNRSAMEWAIVDGYH